MTLGRWLVVIGIFFVVAGLAVMLAAKLGLPRPGRLPGDIVYRGKNTVFYFPIATSIILSILLTIVLSLLARFR